jgi:7-carboxy-7-deazaguanine synthase
MSKNTLYTKEKRDLVNSGMALPVMEHFYTIQGEGVHSGVPCYFVRLGGCDVGCPWCDVKDSWEQEIHPIHTVEEIVSWVGETKAPRVVITGGEPLMHKLNLICELFQTKGINCHIETSGAHPFSGNWDWFTLSPKKRKLPKSENFDKADELKVVISRSNDFLFAEEQAKKVNPNCKLYLQPEWSKEQTILQEIIDYVKDNPRWNISLQTHKYMDIP